MISPISLFCWDDYWEINLNVLAMGWGWGIRHLIIVVTRNHILGFGALEIPDFGFWETL